MENQNSRHVIKKVQGMPASDGAGVKLTRIIGSPQLAEIDPFLMLDYFESTDPNDYIAGFPPHPHRGFETVTYLLAGQMRHKDNQGHEGVIKPGGVQWMTAGKGIIHSEMPEQKDGLLKGFQLWVNLPSHAKMTEPNYQEYGADKIGFEERDGSTVKVITGSTSHGTKGPVVNEFISPLMIDVEMQPGANFTETLQTDSNAFIYVVSGSVEVIASDNGRTAVESTEIALLSSGDRLRLQATTSETQFLLVAASALNEPVVRGGPFVMNSQQEIEQAFSDYKNGLF